MRHFTLALALVILAAFATPLLAEGDNAKTVKNLKDAYIGETTASAKYAAFAKKAKDEGHPAIAALFNAASKAEKIHATNHGAVLTQLGQKPPAVDPKFEVKSTRENLEAAIAGESHEATTMYPAFLKDAKNEKVSKATISLNYAYKTEQRHKVLYETALKTLHDNSTGTLPTRYMVCPVCGNTYDGDGPARCGLCMTTKDKFITVN